ncbi:MAG: WecB/TagA/CpsF family glycosyltransferase [Lachnospiraceae bacterium]|nr:WecB/TagA/CpsF family glycosyltransferase [Lachnospiraceae bacterium]
MMEQTGRTFQRTIDKSLIPTCRILGVEIAAIDMDWLLAFTQENMEKLRGDAICAVNVYSDVTAYRDPEFCGVLNDSALCMSDGGPLSTVGRRRGCSGMQRVTGPGYMGEIFRMSAQKGWRHYFYGSTEETLDRMKERLLEAYPGLGIVGMYSPPFRPLTEEEDRLAVERINETHPDFVWVGLGCPRQERWMHEHLGRVGGLMCGVGAGFDYYAGNIARAPEWMQRCNLEWVYRLIQEPRRLFGKYWSTNFTFIWQAGVRGK